MAPNSYPPLITNRSPSIERARREFEHPTRGGAAQATAVYNQMCELELAAQTVLEHAVTVVRDKTLAADLARDAAAHATRALALGDMARSVGGAPPTTSDVRTLLDVDAASLDKLADDAAVENALHAMRAALATAWADVFHSDDLEDDQRERLFTIAQT